MVIGTRSLPTYLLVSACTRGPGPFGPVDARSSTAVTVATTPLRTGSYVVESIRVAALQLELANSAPIAPAGCCQQPTQEGESPTHRGVPCTVGQLVEARAASAIVLPFANPPLLQVNQDGTAEVHVVVDGPAFVDLITSQAYTCGAAQFPTPTPAELAQVVTVN